MFLDMCMLAGCDYVPSVPGLGIKTAHRLVRQHRTPERLLRALAAGSAGLPEASVLPPRFVERYRHARLAFRHQVSARARGARALPARGRPRDSCYAPRTRACDPCPLSAQRVYDVTSRALTTLRPFDETDTVLALLGANAAPEAARALIDRCIGAACSPEDARRIASGLSLIHI